MKLTKRDIQEGFNALKKKARKAYSGGAYSEALHYLDVCSNIGGQFNLQYADDDLELLLSKIAKNTI